MLKPFVISLCLLLTGCSFAGGFIRGATMGAANCGVELDDTPVLKAALAVPHVGVTIYLFLTNPVAGTIYLAANGVICGSIWWVGNQFISALGGREAAWWE